MERLYVYQPEISSNMWMYIVFITTWALINHVLNHVLNIMLEYHGLAELASPCVSPE